MNSGRGLRLTRVERSAQRRRSRALAHLERVRGRAAGARGRRPSRRGRVLLLAVSIAAGALAGGPLLRAAAYGFSGETPRVDAIHVRGAGQLSPDAVAAATGIAPGAALASVDPAEVAERVAELPWIARARAVRLPAGPIVVAVQERVPVAVARAGASAAFVDAVGTPFAPVDGEPDAELPRLRLAEGFVIGEPDVRLAAALELAYRLPGLGLALPVEVRVAADDDPEGFSLRLSGLAGRIVLGRHDLEARLADLARLLAAGLPEAATAASLDLRFADRAVLRKGPSRGGAAKAAAAHGSAAPSTPRPSR